MDEKILVSETCLDSNDDNTTLKPKKKKMQRKSQSTVLMQGTSDDTDEDVIPSSQSKTSRWHREKMKKIGIAKPKGTSIKN